MTAIRNYLVALAAQNRHSPFGLEKHRFVVIEAMHHAGIGIKVLVPWEHPGDKAAVP